LRGRGNCARPCDHSRAGNLAGIRTEAAVQLPDPDDEPLGFTGTVTSGTVAGDGTKIAWQRKVKN